MKWIREDNVPSSLMTEDPREHGCLPLIKISPQEGTSQLRVASWSICTDKIGTGWQSGYLGLPEVDVSVAERGEEYLDAHLHGLRRGHLHLLDRQRLDGLPCHRGCRGPRKSPAEKHTLSLVRYSSLARKISSLQVAAFIDHGTTVPRRTTSNLTLEKKS